MGPGFSSLVDGNGTAARQYGAIGPDTHKGIAAHFLSAFDGFEQKRLWFVLREAQKGRYWGFQVGGQRAVDRNQAVLRSHLQEFVPRGGNGSIDRHPAHTKWP